MSSGESNSNRNVGVEVMEVVRSGMPSEMWKGYPGWDLTACRGCWQRSYRLQCMLARVLTWLYFFLVKEMVVNWLDCRELGVWP